MYLIVLVLLTTLNLFTCKTNNEKQVNVADLHTQETHSHGHNHHVNSGGSHDGKARSDDTERSNKGYQTDEHFNKDNHGKHGKIHEKKRYQEAGASANTQHEEGHDYNKHEEEGKSVKAAKFGEKEGHKKGHKTKGYHNRFLKDEYHREHKFYDNYHKKGNYKKKGNYSNGFKAKQGGHKKGDSKKSGYQNDQYGKLGHHNKGHYEDDRTGKSSNRGNNQYQNAREHYGGTRGSNAGRQYAYQHYGY